MLKRCRKFSDQIVSYLKKNLSSFLMSDWIDSKIKNKGLWCRFKMRTVVEYLSLLQKTWVAAQVSAGFESHQKLKEWQAIGNTLSLKEASRHSFNRFSPLTSTE